MIVVHAVSRAKPEHRDEYAATLLQMQRSTHEQDEGCLSYRFYTDLEDDCRFICVEEWRDAEALAGHLAAPHMAEAREVLARTREGAGEITVFEAERRGLPET